jgi:cytochrome oxidase Cu insertion factor (SCO1/SenC/PrrC family)
MQVRKLQWALLAAALGVVVVIGVVAWQLVPGRSGGSGEALVGGPFTLVDQHGAEVTEEDFAGRFMLVYFGYTFCPDVCPMSLSNMVQALDLLDAEAKGEVVPIMISVDPARDTVEQLADYAPLFGPELVALTGSPEQVDAAAKAYRVYYNKVEQDDPDAYLMDHSAFIYLMGPDGSYRRHFSASASPEELADGLREQLAAG